MGRGLAACLRAIASSAAFSMLSGGQRRMEGNRWPICSEQEVALGCGCRSGGSVGFFF
jgi:hypothetical protein